MNNHFWDMSKVESSRQTRIIWRAFISLLILIVGLLLLSIPPSPLSVPCRMGAAIAGVLCGMFILWYALSVLEDERRQFGTDPNLTIN